MFCQVARRPRIFVVYGVRWRADNGNAQIGADQHSYHILGDVLAQSHPASNPNRRRNQIRTSGGF
jgi:hypothetical protein